jgi:hypothetical protein
MLFDLSSTRRRRTAVRFIYGTLALLIAAGLVIFGIGTGGGNGGLASSLNNSSGNGNSTQNANINKEIKAAEAKVKAAPNSAASWNALIQARWEQAGSSANYDATTETYSVAGKTALKDMLTAYTKYTSLLKGTPDESTTYQAGHAYTVTGDYASATGAWQAFLQAAPGALKGFECLAFNGYAAGTKYTNLANEAATKSIALTPKLDQLTVKSEFKQVKASKTTAQQAALASC